MTREEAIDLLDNLIGMVEDNHQSDYDTALQMAIKALEQEPCGNAIDRAKAIKIASGYCHPANVAKELAKLPPVNLMLCEDAISREDALMCLTGEIKETDTIETIIARFARRIRKLPPVTPQPKIGHWIEKDGFDRDTYYDCSECGESWTTIMGTPWDNGMAYCPNCGAKMIEPQGSEE